MSLLTALVALCVSSYTGMSNYSIGKQQAAYFDTSAPKLGANYTANATNTYQCSTANLNRLHRFTAKVDCWLTSGTGSSVTSSSSTGGGYIAGQEVFWTPVLGAESIGISTVDGAAFSATNWASVSIVTNRTFPIGS